jgi:CO/xanthine dehydrogenase FAD-binding subunit
LKPPRFQYDDPRTVDEALALLTEYGDDAKVLAGGQSLVPLLNFRLAAPGRLVDINRIGELALLERRDGVLRIGALTRHTAIERSALVARNWGLLTEAVRWVGHPQIRSRGTVGGSVAHADPAAELPVSFAALDARFRARSTRGERVIPWHEFFVTHLTTTLEPDELLVGIEVPAVPARTGWAFTEYARRHGDFGLGGAAVQVTLDENGACRSAAIALLAAAPTPIRATAAEQSLLGLPIDAGAAASAARLAVADIDPTGDIHGSTRYRKHLIEALVRRGVVAAAARAVEDGDG